MFSRSWCIFWHPLGRINSGDISFLVFVFDFSVWQRHLADFFHYSQIEARCHLYWFDMYKSANITFYSQSGWTFKVIQAVSVVIWMESELISPVWNVCICFIGLNFNYSTLLSKLKLFIFVLNRILSEYYVAHK